MQRPKVRAVAGNPMRKINETDQFRQSARLSQYNFWSS